MTDLRMLSYNVRYAGAGDHHDEWDERRDGVAALLEYHAPDVFGLQEPLARQCTFLGGELPAYTFHGGARTESDEHAPLAVRTGRLTVREHGTFWLSETPAAESVGWDAKYPRIATWARIECDARTERGEELTVLVCNTHFDHEGERARRESARLLRERLPELAGDDPVVLLGDLNCPPGAEPHAILTDRFVDAAEAADVRHGPDTSVSDFQALIHSRRIDHVLVSPAVEVRAFATLTDRDDRGRYPSDHLPVAARLRI